MILSKGGSADGLINCMQAIAMITISSTHLIYSFRIRIDPRVLKEYFIPFSTASLKYL
jgi:hypothetical protein